MINSVMQQGLYGMQSSQRSMAEQAQNIASANVKAPAETPPTPTARAEPSLEESLVQLRQDQTLFDASAKVFELGNRALGSLLDTSV